MTRALLAIALCALGIVACGVLGDDEPETDIPRITEADRAEWIAQALAAPDRPEGDRARDAQRHAAEVLALLRLEPGERVLDLGAGGGYMTWLLSSIVGPDGAVTAQDPRAWVEEVPTLQPMMARLTSARPNVTHRVMEFDNLDGQAWGYDAASMTLIYHDVVLMGIDRIAMNQRIFDLLRPGARFLVVDHHARPGSGTRDIALHRIDAELVRREIEQVGFRLARQSGELANPADDRTLSIFDPEIRGRTSQFAYLFVKPER